MSRYPTRDIPITQIYLDPENPRHDVVSNQRAALVRMLAEEDRAEDKILELATDIVEQGMLSPGDLFYVLELDADDDTYVVLEGNRRLTALKVLWDPGILPTQVSGSTTRKLKQLSVLFHRQPIDEAPCVIFPSREEANHWIRIRHTGENRGKGVVQWDAKAVARFNERFGEVSPSLQVIRFVRENAALDDEQHAKLDRLPLTNLDRLLGTPEARSALGLTLVDGHLQTTLATQEVTRGLARVLLDIADGRVSVNDLRAKGQRQAYAERVAKEEQLAYDSNASMSWALDSAFGQKEQGTTTSGTPSSKRSRQLSTTRKTVIPSTCVIAIPDPRLNAIYRELRKLNVNQFPNAVAVLLRVFLELSVEQYLKKHKAMIQPKAHLDSKVQAAAADLKGRKVLSDGELKAANQAVSSPHSLFSVNTLHQYVHSAKLTPQPDAMKTTWDDMQLFIEKLWE
jgi:hypothetical protein